MGKFADWTAELEGSPAAEPVAPATPQGGSKFAQWTRELEGQEPDRVQTIGMLPDESTWSPGKLDLKGGRGFIPDKRPRAVFLDITPSGETGYTAEELRDARPDTKEKSKTAFLGGTIQGATFGFGDEAAAMFADRPYAEARDENRRAFKDAQAMDPKSYAMGHLTGNAALLPATPSLAPTAAKPLLSLANTGRAALGGGLQALGESEADLTKGDLYGSAKDTAKGAAIAAGANAALGGVAKAYRAGAKYISGLPDRVVNRADEQLLDAATLGAPAGMRDKLQGELGSERQQVLDLIKNNPELEKAIREGRKADAVNILRTMQTKHAAMDAEAVAAMDSGARTIAPAKAIENVPGYRDRSLSQTQELPALTMEDLVSGKASSALPRKPGSLEIDANPLVAKLEARRKALAANPSLEAQAEAAAYQKRIDYLKENWIPAPPPKKLEGSELLAALAEKADTGDKQRIGSNAKEFLKVAEQHELGDAYNQGPEALKQKLDDSMISLGKRREDLYSNKVKEPVKITAFTAPLAEWADELSKNAATLKDANNVKALIGDIWTAHGRDGAVAMSPKEARALISGVQENAFSGAYIDPTAGKAMQRKAAGLLKDAFDQHVEKTAGKKVGEQIRDLNKEYSALLSFRTAAEKRAAEASFAPPVLPDTRTGRASVGAVRDMINATKDEDVRRELTGELYIQVGTENAHKLAALDDKAALMSRLEEPLTHLAERGTTSPTTLRAHTGSVKGYLERGGIGAGVALAATGSVKEGLAVIGATLVTKYGIKPFQAAESGIGAMVEAYRRGATPAQLRKLGELAKVPREMAEDTITALAPRERASKNGSEASE